MMSNLDQDSKITLSLIHGARGVLIDCIESMGTLSTNNQLEGGDATNWIKQFSDIRKKLDDCEDILDDLNETHMPMNTNQAL